MSIVDTTEICAHCGDTCLPDGTITCDNLPFCCTGCSMVYSLLLDHGMGLYYNIEKTPGIKNDHITEESWAFLDDKEVIDRLLDFQDKQLARVTFLLPQIHCSSCLWLLERIERFDAGIISSRVDFLSKKVSIQYDSEITTLKAIVLLLISLGYKPRLNLNRLDIQESEKSIDKILLYKLGLAGFSFGNIMLLSFPEYLGLPSGAISSYIGYINIILILPVIFYSGIGFLKSAITSLKNRALNIDVPIALGITTLFGRSLYDILSLTGEGYLDSLAGLVFFLLIGKWFQNYTYRSLDFDRNYTSYFPISSLIKKNDDWLSVTLDKLKQGDRILVKNEELIPADSILIKGTARIDYSFVTGESEPIRKINGDKIFAGGKQKGSNLELEIIKSVDQSYLTQLWNENTFKDGSRSSSSKLIDTVSKYFTITILFVAAITLGYWIRYDMGLAFNAFTAVLIVACPCALALAIPFTYGNILRILSRSNFYLRNVHSIENIQEINHIVFDKTGTLTDHSKLRMEFQGAPLSIHEGQLLKSLATQSTHPLSRSIVQLYNDLDNLEVKEYNELPGKGISGIVDGHKIEMGSLQFLFGEDIKKQEKGVFTSIDGSFRGQFNYKDELRLGVFPIIKKLGKRHRISVISGDSNHDMDRMTTLLGDAQKIHFNQSPQDKLNYIRNLQQKGETVMMIGDGLNDAGALKQSNVGVVLTDDTNNFTPSSDAILSASQFEHLSTFLSYIRMAKWVIYGAFILAFMYNLIGLYFATTGQLSPVVAAILMPLSSITIVIYGVGMSSILKMNWNSSGRSDEHHIK